MIKTIICCVCVVLCVCLCFVKCFSNSLGHIIVFICGRFGKFIREHTVLGPGKLGRQLCQSVQRTALRSAVLHSGP